TEARMITAAMPAKRKLKKSEKSSTTISPSNAFPRSSATISTSDHSADTASPASPRATLATRLVPPRIGSVTSPTTISPAAISSASSGPNRLMSSINQYLGTGHPTLGTPYPSLCAIGVTPLSNKSIITTGYMPMATITAVTASNDPHSHQAVASTSDPHRVS